MFLPEVLLWGACCSPPPLATMSPRSPSPPPTYPCKHPASRLPLRLFSSPSTYATEGDESFIAAHNALGPFPRDRGRQT